MKHPEITYDQLQVMKTMYICKRPLKEIAERFEISVALVKVKLKLK